MSVVMLASTLMKPADVLQHGLHKILNPDPEEYAISLHRKSKSYEVFHPCAELISQVYAPPNAANEGCQVFDEETGKATHVIQYNLYSEMGRRNNCGGHANTW